MAATFYLIMLGMALGLAPRPAVLVASYGAATPLGVSSRCGICAPPSEVKDRAHTKDVTEGAECTAWGWVCLGSPPAAEFG